MTNMKVKVSLRSFQQKHIVSLSLSIYVRFPLFSRVRPSVTALCFLNGTRQECEFNDDKGRIRQGRS